jgi:hypothetical protein
MDRMLRTTVGAMACATTIGLSAAQTAPQNPSQTSIRERFVAIGCVSREGQNTAQDRGSATSEVTFIITDTRGQPPLKYRLDGDTDQLAIHVGHTLEITGPVTPVSSAREGANGTASLPTLKVQSLTYISTTCAKSAK